MMTMTRINSSQPPSSSSSLHTSYQQNNSTTGTLAGRAQEQEYYSAVERMQAKQDAWGRAARSASASGSISESGSGTGSRSPSRPAEGMCMTSSFSGSAGGLGEGSGGVQKKGRKKVAKACLACQKSHVTCDDKRPCTRCMKKGIGQQCTEGVRKKAKYLLEADEKSAVEAPPPPIPTASSSTSLLAQHAMLHEQSISPHHQISPEYNYQQTSNPVSNLPPSLQQGHGRLPDDIWLAPPLEGDSGIGLSGVGDNRSWFGNGGMNMGDMGNNTGFNNNGMTAATSEYAMLDSMFAMDPVFPGLGGLDNLDQPLSLDQQFVPNWGNDNSNNNGNTNHTQNIQSQSHPVHPTFAMPNQQSQNAGSQNNHTDLLPNPPQFEIPSTPWSMWLNSTPQTGDNGQVANQAQGQALAQTKILEDGMTGGGLLASGTNKKTMSSSEVYKKVVKPYDYTEGYHALMEYLTKNFERKEILRVVHSLASYRPSLIALQMPMSEEDEVFLEKSFQRTLIELEKLISYSATPTAVWRRTGEVCYANPEFCSLVKRNEDDLLATASGKKQYIYQLFSKPSIIAYWENFSLHAFENTTQNFFQPTGLVVGNGNVDCSCCYTIRRDVFDLPSVVIGQFLPIPADG